MKHVYRALIFVLFFVGSALFFGGNMKETKGVGSVKCIEAANPSFPIMTVRTQGYDINVLHGYNSNLKASLNRESMTPVGIDKKLLFLVSEDSLKIRKIKYELRKVNDSTLMEANDVSVIDDTKEGKVITVVFDTTLDQGKEYAMKITAITKEGKKIHYFTHLKYYSDSFLQEKMTFITDFHNNTLKKNGVNNISQYLESYATDFVDGEDYAHVDIKSSKALVGWGSLSPQVISDVVPTIKEYNTETAAVCMEYYVSINGADSKKEICNVKEFYRVRYSGGRMYLLKFERDMQSMFRFDNLDLDSQKFDLGVIDSTGTNVLYSENDNRVAIAQSGELWQYSVNDNTMHQVFSFLGDSEDYKRAGYNQHDIKIMSIDDDGNMNFCVYGYMNSGDYEGCVGMLWYKYIATDMRLEEQLFIPMDTTYQILKENLDEFSYVNGANVFYFAMNNSVYCYDEVSKELQTIAKNISQDEYCYVKEVGMLAWQQKTKNITMLDLETKKQRKIKAGKGECIKLIGTIDTNVVYGLAKTGDIAENIDGSDMFPMYKVVIVDKEGNVLKEYEKNGVYVISAEVKNNVIKMECAKKSMGTYTKVNDESIQSHATESVSEKRKSSKTLENGLVIRYLQMANGIKIEAKPTLQTSKQTVITENSVVRLDNELDSIRKYYVYAEGVITESFQSPNKAIMAAEESMGAVINNKNQVVYERAGKYKNNAIGNIESVTMGGGTNTKGACLSMVLKYNHVSCDSKKLSESDKSVYSLLKANMDETSDVVNLKGCTLDEVLYFVSGGRPVIALTENNTFVVITEYTETSVTYIDPVTGKSKTVGMKAGENMFEKSGNTFVSYVD